MNRTHCCWPFSYKKIPIICWLVQGKSTLIEALGTYILDDLPKKDDKSLDYRPNKLAVVCIDPSSSISGGSILGDKTRMTELSRHDRSFVRPSATSGVVGGLSAYTDDVVSTCLAAGYPLTLVETVGLGQSEIEVAQSVDMLLLLLPPGGGDELQGVKKGIVEVSDMFVVTKADGNLSAAAKSTAASYRAALTFLNPSVGMSAMCTANTGTSSLRIWRPPVILTSSATCQGLDTLWGHVCQYRNHLMETGMLESQRQKQRQYWMWKHFQKLVQDKTHQDPRLANTARQLEASLEQHEMTPRVAATLLLAGLLRVEDLTA
jgi:LAO/AO transport system kinase